MPNRKEMEVNIVKRIGQKAWDDIQQSITFEPKDIWASERPRLEESAVLLQALYKDLNAISYADLKESVKAWFPQSNSAIQHNVKKARKKMRDWTKKILKPLPAKERKKVAARASRPHPCEDVTLWIDSTDFPISGEKGILDGHTSSRSLDEDGPSSLMPRPGSSS